MQFIIENRAALLMLAGMAVATWVLLRRWNRYFKRTRRDEKRPHTGAIIRQMADRTQPLADAPPEILRWQVEMHETARDLKAELDTKISVLQRLVILAREESQRLESLVHDSKQAGSGDEP